MRLPNPDRAVVDAAKVRDYLLSPTHPVGRSKAHVFAAVGYTAAEWSRLHKDLLAVAESDTARPLPPSAYGQKYVVPAILHGPAGRDLTVVTVWIVRAREGAPHLVTAYPGEPR